MKALVTGANGLVGANLVRELLRTGHSVRVLVRQSSNLAGLAGLEVEYAYGDVRDPAALENAARGCELMFHTAAVFAYWGYERSEMMQTARQGAENAVSAAKRGGVRRVVLTSSTAVFGGSKTPTARDETAPFVGPESLDYLYSKALQEQAAMDKAGELDVELVVANPTLILGPNDFRPSTSLATITAYVDAPLQFTAPGGVNIVHVADIARGHLLLAERGEPYQRYILCAENAEWREIHSMLSELCGLPPPRLSVGRPVAYLAGAAMELGAALTGKAPLLTRAMALEVGHFFWGSNAKACALGYTARPMRQTLIDTLAWFATSPHMTERRKKKLRLAPEVIARQAELQAR